jgi:hypothetical protein
MSIVKSLVLGDYGVKTGYCQLCRASLLRFSVEMFPASLRLRQKTFATTCENLFACIQYFGMCLAAAEKVLWPIICRLSGNNRPITDLKNGRLIGFADYLPINRLIPNIPRIGIMVIPTCSLAIILNIVFSGK